MKNNSVSEVTLTSPPTGLTPARRTLPGLRWWMISLLMLGSILSYLARNTLSVAEVRLQDTLHISERQYSWITGAFQGGIILQPIVGYALDLVGLRIGVAIFAAAWAVFNMAHGLAGSWRSLAFLRGLMGFAEGSATPAGVKATAEWFPARERGLAAGIYNIGASAGSMLAPPLVAAAIFLLNWQAAFVVTGGLGLAWVVLWLLLYRSPAQHPRLSEKEREYIKAGQETALVEVAARPSVWQIARQRNFWGIAIPRFLADPMWGTLAFWLPLYLKNVRGWDLKQIAMFAWLPFLAADLGCIFGGVLSGALHKRGLSVVNARRVTFTVGACLITSVAFAGRVASPYTAVLLFSVAGFAHQTLSVTVIVMASDLFRRSEVATAAGMAGTFGNAGLLLFTLTIGWLVGRIGYNPFFVCLSVLDVMGAIVLWTLVRERRDGQAA